MTWNPRSRRALSLVFMVLGGLLIYLVQEDIRIGLLLLGLGIALEAIAMVMRRGAGE